MATLPPILNVIDVTSGSVSMVSNHCYYLDHAGTVTLLLPASSFVGDVIQLVSNYNDNEAWVITQNSGQNICYNFHVTTTGTGGSLNSATNNTTIYMICLVANTTWGVLFLNGSVTYT